MVRTFTFMALTSLLVATFSVQGLAQRPFVDFETTNQKNEVCQGKTMGVVPTLLDEYEGLDTYSWNYNAESFREVKNNIAIVNTALPGEKHLGFTLAINDSVKLDTIFVVNVLPKPDVTIRFESGKLSFTTPQVNLSGYQWFYNGAAIDKERNEKVIKKPIAGSYRVVVTGVNGCSSSSETVTVR